MCMCANMLKICANIRKMCAKKRKSFKKLITVLVQAAHPGQLGQGPFVSLTATGPRKSHRSRSEGWPAISFRPGSGMEGECRAAQRQMV